MLGCVPAPEAQVGFPPYPSSPCSGQAGNGRPLPSTEVLAGLRALGHKAGPGLDRQCWKRQQSLPREPEARLLQPPPSVSHLLLLLPSPQNHAGPSILGFITVSTC